MFQGATAFNQPLYDWNVASVTRMDRMFQSATDFNQPLNDWNGANVNDMNKMFYKASDFNQSLNDWNVASVTDMRYMFIYAYDFNQCLSTWADKTPPNVSVNGIFEKSGCPKKDALANIGPWCREDEQCSASLTEKAPIALLTGNLIAPPTNVPIAKQKKIKKKIKQEKQRCTK